MIDSGVQKAAVLMLALGEDEAAEVMKFLSPREVQQLGAAMSTMKSVQSEELEQVLAEFRRETEQQTSIGVDRPIRFGTSFSMRPISRRMSRVYG